MTEDIIKEIYDKYKDIKYGWYDKNGELHDHIYEGFLAKFKMQTTEELKQRRIGMCWEMVELFRDELAKKGIESESYFFCLFEKGYHSHSILVVPCNGKYYWLETSLAPFNKINVYDSLEEIFNTIIDNYHLVVLKDGTFDKKHIRVFNYKKPKDGISCTQFYFHCFGAKRMN